jgi:hypothetical protein
MLWTDVFVRGRDVDCPDQGGFTATPKKINMPIISTHMFKLQVWRNPMARIGLAPKRGKAKLRCGDGKQWRRLFAVAVRRYPVAPPERDLKHAPFS